MLAPALARPSAIALPIPLLPPVTIATFPLSDIASIPFAQARRPRAAPLAVNLSRRCARCRQPVDQIGDQGGPTGLMRGAKSTPVVAVEIFVEKNEVPEVRVRLQLGVVPENRPPTIVSAGEKRDHSPAQVIGD